MVKKIFLLFVLVSFVVWLKFHTDIVEQNILYLVEDAGTLGPLIFILLYTMLTVLLFPAVILTLSGGFLFGPWWGTVLNINGAVFGATIAFLIARYGAEDWVSKKIGDQSKISKLKAGLESEGWKFIAIVRLLPILPFGLLNYALGLTKVTLFSYITVSYICMLPACFGYTYLGSLGRSILDQELQDLRIILVVIGVIVLLFCLPWLIKLWYKKQI